MLEQLRKRPTSLFMSEHLLKLQYCNLHQVALLCVSVTDQLIFTGQYVLPHPTLITSAVFLAAEQGTFI